MNRVAISGGMLADGAVTRGSGISYGYDADGERLNEVQTSQMERLAARVSR